MAVCARSFLISGVAAVGAGAIALTPSVAPPLARVADPAAVHLAAAVQPLDPAASSPVAVATTLMGEAVENLYNAAEPWAQFDADFLSWAVGWVPFVGLLAPQIMFVYALDEPIVQSMLFNWIDFLDGTSSFSEALSNVGTSAGDAYHAFVDTEIAWVQSQSPPYPPIPTPPDLAAVLDSATAGALSDVGAEINATLLSLVP